MRQFLEMERELLRCVLALEPNVSDAREMERMHLRTDSRRRRLLDEDVAAKLEERRRLVDGYVRSRHKAWPSSSDTTSITSKSA